MEQFTCHGADLTFLYSVCTRASSAILNKGCLFCGFIHYFVCCSGPLDTLMMFMATINVSNIYTKESQKLSTLSP